MSELVALVGSLIAYCSESEMGCRDAEADFGLIVLAVIVGVPLAGIWLLGALTKEKILEGRAKRDPLVHFEIPYPQSEFRDAARRKGARTGLFVGCGVDNSSLRRTTESRSAVTCPECRRLIRLVESD